MTIEDAGFKSMVGAGAAFIVACFAAFMTHVWWIMGLLMGGASVPAGRIVIAIFGVLVPPLGCLHGVWLWFH